MAKRPPLEPRASSPVAEALQRGHTAQLAGRLVEAAGYYRRVLERDPANFDALQLLGLARVHSGDVEAGIALMRRALVVNDRAAGVHNNLGSALLGIGRRAEALEAFRMAVSLEPEHPLMWRNLARAQQESGDTPAAIGTLLALLQRHPGDAPAHFALGLALRALSRPREALVAFDRALALEPNDAHAHAQRGLAIADLGDTHAAYDALRGAVAVAGPQQRRWMTLMCACLGLENAEWSTWAVACEVVRQVADPAPDAIDPMRPYRCTSDLGDSG